MSELIRSIAARLRGLYDRRQSPRYKAQCGARLLFSLSLLDEREGSEGAHLLPLEGYTRDISEIGLGLVVPSMRIGDRHITDENCTLRIVLLDLPGGEVEIHAAPVRYEPLHENNAEGKHLIGVRITGISGRDKQRLVEYLRMLRNPRARATRLRKR